MTGVILAAGQGARLNGGQGDTPKCLVPLGGESLLARNRRVLRDAGVDDVIVVVGCAADTVRRSCPDVRFVENTIFARTNSLYSLWLARPHLADGFLVMNCDVLVHPQLVSDLIGAWHEDALLVDYRSDQTLYGDEEMKVTVRRGCVSGISKAMAPEEADGENVGIAKFGRDGARVIIEEMNALVEAGEFKAWVPRAFERFASRRPLHVIGTRGLPWIEIDFPDDYRRAIDVVLPRIDAHAARVGVSNARIARTA
jgi:L-glutamine-phosphate cytidylyltransferase